MTSSQVDLTFRVRPTFGPEQYIQLVQLLAEGMFFDEETLFELMIQKNNDERLHDDLTSNDLGTFINPQTWPDIHQIVFSNPWMKGMNLKFQFVRRHDFINILLKCEMERTELQHQLVAKVHEFLQGESYSESGVETHDQERERLFGSMLMNGEVILAARQSFLAGRFQETVANVVHLLTGRLETLLRTRIKKPEDAILQLSTDPPRLLLPDLSGKELHEELAGIGHICTGILTLTQGSLQPKSSGLDDPAKVLRWLVLVGMLLDRLEGASFNPALQVKPAIEKEKSAKPAALKAKTAQTKKPVSEKVQPVGKSAKQKTKTKTAKPAVRSARLNAKSKKKTVLKKKNKTIRLKPGKSAKKTKKK